MQSLKTIFSKPLNTEGGYFRLKTLFFFSFLGLNQLLWAQNREVPLVHFDRPFYVVGDDVWFKIYMTGNIAQSSAIVHLEVVAPNGKTYLKQNLKIKDRMAVGDFRVPLNWEEGNYLFRAYTLWQTDVESAPQAVSNEAIVAIYNDLMPQKKLVGQATAPKMGANNAPNGSYKIEWAGGSSLNRRETKKVQFKLTNANGLPLKAAVSVSVFEQIAETNKDLSLNEQRVLGQLGTSQAADLKPVTALMLTGTVIDPLSKNRINDRFMSLYTPATGTFKRVVARDGVFKTTLPEYCGEAPVQMLSLNPNHSFPLEMTVKTAAELPVYSNNELPVRTAAIDKYLKNNQLRRQTNDLFELKNQNFDSAACKPINRVYDAEKTYQSQSFYNLTTFSEFVKEVLLSVSVYKNERGRTLRLGRTDDTKPYQFAPWYLVNGLFVDAEETIMNMPFGEFKTIQVFNRKKLIESQFDSLMFRYGVLRLDINDNPRYLQQLDFKYQNIAGFATNRPFSPPSVSAAKTAYLSPLLTWQPYLTTNEMGLVDLEIPTNDVKGQFVLRICGMTADNQPISQVLVLEVK